MGKKRKKCQKISRNFSKCLTKFKMVNLSRVNPKRANDILYKINNRRHPNEKNVAFKEQNPLVLKNSVEEGKRQLKLGPCFSQMQSLLGCLEKFDSNETMCAKEVESFQNCEKLAAAEARKSRENKNKDVLNHQLTTKEINKYISQYPKTDRNRRNYIPKYTNKYA